MKRPEEMTFAERIYLPEILRGLVITGVRFWRNLFLNVAHQIGLLKSRKSMVTTQYPNELRRYHDHYRGSHRLTLKEDGSVRCTACFLCATACPANCIYIEAGESPDPTVEKYPVRYEIDTLRCIYCGYCVEACPCDAIRMDTYVHPKIWGYSRLDFVETKQELMERSRVIAGRGRGALLADQVKGYQ